MDPPSSPPTRALSTVELAVRHALEHASTLGDHQTAAALSSILEAIALRQSQATAQDHSASLE